MAGLRGNVAWLMGARQAAKGTAATPSATTSWKTAFAGGNIGPVRETDHLAETDSSRDQGILYAVTGGVEGEPEVYVRDASIGAYLSWAMGTTVPTGTTPNYTHAITPNNALPYVTLWRNVGDLLWEEFKDCKIGSLNISAEAGQPLTATIGVQGLTSTRLTADPSTAGTVVLESSTVYNYNNATVTLAGGVTALVGSFELGIENNLSRQQTDAFTPYDVVEGTREVTLGFDLIFETLTEYNKFHYGGASGTAFSSSIYNTDAVFDFAGPTANQNLKFTLPSIAYEEFPVEPSAAGDPVTVSVRAVAQRSGSPVLTVEAKNQVVTYATGT